MRNLKVRIGINSENKITFMEPVNRAAGKAIEILIVNVRLITDEEEYEDMEHLMQEGRVYKRRSGKMREIR